MWTSCQVKTKIKIKLCVTFQDLLLSSGIDFYSRQVKSSDFKNLLHEVRGEMSCEAVSLKSKVFSVDCVATAYKIGINDESADIKTKYLAESDQLRMYLSMYVL
jgi:hypothetical protein